MDYEKVPWPFPTSGLLTELAAVHVPPTGLTVCENLFYLSPDILASRGGWRKLYAPAGAAGTDVLKMYYWDKINELIWNDSDRNLWRNSTLIGNFVHPVRDFCAFGTGVTSVLVVAQEEAGLGHTLHTYDGTTYTRLLGTNVPTPELVMVRQNRLFGTREDANPSRVYWSDAGDLATWAGNANQGGWIDVAPGEDGGIRDWIDIAGVLYLFKRNTIYMMTGWNSDTYEIQKMSECDRFREGTIADVRRGVLYATFYGVSPLGARWGAVGSKLTTHVDADFRAFLTPTTNAEATYSDELNAYLICNGGSTLWVSNLNHRPDIWTTFTLPFNCVDLYQADQLYAGSDNGEVWYYDHAAVADYA